MSDCNIIELEKLLSKKKSKLIYSYTHAMWGKMLQISILEDKINLLKGKLPPLDEKGRAQ